MFVGSVTLSADTVMIDTFSKTMSCENSRLLSRGRMELVEQFASGYKTELIALSFMSAMLVAVELVSQKIIFTRYNIIYLCFQCILMYFNLLVPLV